MNAPSGPGPKNAAPRKAPVLEIARAVSASMRTSSRPKPGGGVWRAGEVRSRATRLIEVRAAGGRSAGEDEGAHRLPRLGVGDPSDRDQVRDAREEGSPARDPAGPATAVDPGHGPAASRTRLPRRPPKRGPTRCCRGPTAGCSTARTRWARSGRCRSTPEEPQARPRARPEFLRVRQGRGRDERLGAGLLRTGDRRGLEDAIERTTQMFRPRGLHLDDRHVRCADGAGSPRRSSTRRSTWSNSRGAPAGRASVVLYLRRSRTSGASRLWNDILVSLETAPGPGRGKPSKTYVLVEQLEASSSSWNPRRAGPALRRLQHGRWDFIVTSPSG